MSYERVLYQHCAHCQRFAQQAPVIAVIARILAVLGVEHDSFMHLASRKVLLHAGHAFHTLTRQRPSSAPRAGGAFNLS